MMGKKEELPKPIRILIGVFIITILYLSTQINKQNTQPISKDPYNVHITTYTPDNVRYYTKGNDSDPYLEVFYKNKDHKDTKFDIKIEDIEIHGGNSIVEEERIEKNNNVLFTRLKLTKEDYINAVGKNNYKKLTK